MDISSATSSTVSVTDTSASSQSQRSSKSDVSFEEEMKKVSESESKETSSTKKDEKSESSNKSDKANNTDAENKTEQKQEASVKDENSGDDSQNQDSKNSGNENSQLLSGEVSMNDLQNLQKNGLLNSGQLNNIQMLVNANQQLSDITRMTDAFATTKVDYTSISMGADDAKFFSDLVQNADKTLQNVVSDLQSGIEQNVQQATKNVKVSSTLMNALQEAVKTNQPFRISFDKDVSVVIKVNKDGALSATFIPGDKAVEEYLRQNISVLRQRFDEQELSYNELSYSRQKQDQGQNNRRNNKEKDHE